MELYQNAQSTVYKHTECICDAKREGPGFDWAQPLMVLGLWVSIAPLPAARFAVAAGLRDTPYVCGGEVVLDYSHCKRDALDGTLQHQPWVYQKKNCFPYTQDALKYVPQDSKYKGKSDVKKKLSSALNC